MYNISVLFVVSGIHTKENKEEMVEKEGRVAIARGRAKWRERLLVVVGESGPMESP